MKKATTRIFFGSFCALWCVLTVANAAKKPAAFSENESRVLAGFPTFTWSRLVEGDYMQEMDAYFNDQFLWRDAWITVQSTVEYLTGKRESNQVYLGKNALLPKIDLPDVQVVKNNIEGVNAFAKKHEIPSYLLLVPSAAAVQPQLLPLFATDWGELQAIADIYGRLEGTAGIDAAKAMMQENTKQLYYRTDHHWTTYGAYLAYTRFCEAAGFTPGSYTAQAVSRTFHGTLYSKSGVRFLKSDTIEAFSTPFDGGCEVWNGSETKQYSTIYFSEYLSQKDQYAYFLGPNSPVVTLHGTAGTGRSLLMFKDSYAHCFAPMLLQHYDTITLVDLRYLNQPVGELVSPDDYDAVLHLYSTDVFVHQNVAYKLGGQ